MKLIKASLSWPSQQTHQQRHVAGVHKVWEEMTKVQLELNFQIIELWLKVQPSTPLKVREEHANAIIAKLDEIDNAV